MRIARFGYLKAGKRGKSSGAAQRPRVHPLNTGRGWMVWENEILVPFLTGHPDTIRFTSYEEL